MLPWGDTCKQYPEHRVGESTTQHVGARGQVILGRGNAAKFMLRLVKPKNNLSQEMFSRAGYRLGRTRTFICV